jgi:CDP-diacylglycerol---glycerol-3-phosphate 3-phosphatidyltransferase
MLKTTANKITMFRIILIPVFLVLAYTNHMYTALAVYIIACLSDVADGYIARHYNQVSDFGKFMDPLADKMLVLAAMCFFIENGQMPGWCVAIVLFREFAVSGLRLIAVEQGRVIAAAWSGKLKTGCTMVGLSAMMLFSEIEMVNIIFTALILITTVGSGIHYFWVNSDVFKNAD